MAQQRGRDGPTEPLDDPGARSRRFGRYTLIKKLATGGMAEIWLATQKGVADFTRFVVLKKILSHLAEQETFVKMFLDEARTCAQLTHPNIVQIYDLGREANAYFIAMEYIAGENLAAIAWRGVKKQIPLVAPYTAKMVADAAKALHYAHQLRGANGQPLQIVHRDVSPQNILVTYEGEVKVVDFGIAKAASKSEHTKTGMLKGKFSYMSPEQCLGEPLDARADIFALGIVLYELVTGKRLFKHESELMILEMIVKRPIVRPAEAAEGVPPKLDAIIMQALEKAPEARFQTAQEMQIALEEYLRDDPISANSTEISAYMRALFHDKIDEKRRLCEAAARNELPALEERTEQSESSPPRARSSADGRLAERQPMPSRSTPGAKAAQTSTANGASPPSNAGAPKGSPSGWISTPGPEATDRAMQLGRFEASAPGSAGGTPLPHQAPSAMTAMPMMSTSYVGGYTNVLEPPQIHGWLIHALIALAAAIVVGAVAVLALRPGAEPALLKRGTITLVSRPAGARVFVDDQPLADVSGKGLVTPVELKNLDYGSSYRIRVERSGHKPDERTITMNDKLDRQELTIALEPKLGLIVATVIGEEAAKVEVFFGHERVGNGPTIKKERAPGNVAISARLSGRTCTAEPEIISLAANATEVTTIVCKRLPASATPVAKGALRTEPPEPSPAAARRDNVAREGDAQAPNETRGASAAGCAPKPGSSPGFATINSTPYADIYVDGKKVGQTPLPRLKLPAGCVVLRAVNPESGREKTVQLEIQANIVSIYDLEL
jgi:eukaryotic-like serine/threonine-protein kinase